MFIRSKQMTDKKHDEAKKQYEEPTLEKRERLIEVTEGAPLGGATP